MTSSGLDINLANAHNAKITSMEFCQFNGQDVVFSAGLDNMLKAWTINTQTQTFTPVDSKDLQSPVHSL